MAPENNFEKEIEELKLLLMDSEMKREEEKLQKEEAKLQIANLNESNGKLIETVGELRDQVKELTKNLTQLSLKLNVDSGVDVSKRKKANAVKFNNGIGQLFDQTTAYCAVGGFYIYIIQIVCISSYI